MFANERPLDPASSIPLYVQLKDVISRSIDSGAFTAGAMMPTESQLIARFGISRHTARQAYQILVNEERLVRIRGKGTFVTAGVTSEKFENIRTKPLIAFLLPDIHEGTMPTLVEHVISTAFDMNYSTTVCCAHVSHKRALQNIENAVGLGASGVVFLPLGAFPFDVVNARVCAALKERELPFAILDIPLRDTDAPFVASDNREGGRIVGRYLQDRGHKEVLVVIDGGNSSINDRVAGIGEVLEKEPRVIQYYTDIENDFEQKLEVALNKPTPPTAIFGIHDIIARRVLSFLQLLRIRVPDDISLIGYDDLDFCRYLHVPLTTVHQSLDLMAKEVVEILLEMIRNPGVTPPSVRMPVRLVERSSVKDI